MNKELTPFQKELYELAKQWVRWAEVSIADGDVAEAKFLELLSRAVDNEGERMIYKHQCDHCQRFSPLPFLIHCESYEIWRKKNDK